MIAGEVPVNKIYEDDEIFAFFDIEPQAPQHFLIIPKKHIATLNDAKYTDATLLGKLSLTASKIAKNLGLEEKGYRVVMNCNQDGGQSVFHIHLHCLAGRALNWPPG
jgi:histidine triad (HIT) family protein